MTIQIWITPISSSSRSAAVQSIAEAIEVDSKRLNLFSLLKLVLHVHVSINYIAYLVYYSC